MSSILGALGGVGGIVSGIIGGVGSIFDFIKSVMKVVSDILIDLVKWYFNLLVEKPELGITIGVLTIYMLT